MLDLRGDPIELTAALVDIRSESGDEARLADEVEAALRAQTSGFEIVRNGNAVLARTRQQRPSRVLLAGHLDTVQVAGNLPSRRDGDPQKKLSTLSAFSRPSWGCPSNRHESCHTTILNGALVESGSQWGRGSSA